MTYKERFVAVVKCQGKILREHNSVVTLPFGSEYSLLLKNLEARRASVKISIDGQEVVRDSSLVVEPNSEVEIERFVDDLYSGNRFKFIQKTEQISDHRGDKIDDGLIRVEFSYEKQKPVTKEIIWDSHHHTHYYHDHYHPPQWTTTYGSTGGRGMSSGDFTITSSLNSPQASFGNEPVAMNYVNVAQESAVPLQDEGITVPGSISSQEFHTVEIGQLEDQKHVIILNLRGTHRNGATPVSQPITTKTKLKCPTCGKVSSSRSIFCSRCGTSLI